MLMSWKERQEQHICGCYRDQGALGVCLHSICSVLLFCYLLQSDAAKTHGQDVCNY